MSKTANIFRRRADAFEALVSRVRDDQWHLATPCRLWDTRELVEHVVTRCHEVVESVGQTPSPAPTVADDALAAFHAARLDVEAVLNDPELVKIPIDTWIGELPAAEMIDCVLGTDIVIHGWDLAKATGQVASMNLLDVRAIFPRVSTMSPELRKPNALGPGIVIFGRQVNVPPGAPAQDRLLGMLGRKPHWTAPLRRRFR